MGFSQPTNFIQPQSRGQRFGGGQTYMGRQTYGSGGNFGGGPSYGGFQPYGGGQGFGGGFQTPSFRSPPSWAGPAPTGGFKDMSDTNRVYMENQVPQVGEVFWDGQHWGRVTSIGPAGGGGGGRTGGGAPGGDALFGLTPPSPVVQPTQPVQQPVQQPATYDWSDHLNSKPPGTKGSFDWMDPRLRQLFPSKPSGSPI